MNGAGAVQGFQVPPEIKQRKGKLDELLSANNDLNGAQVLIFISSLDPPGVQGVVQQLDAGDYASLADSVRRYVTQEYVRKKMPEVVRKKPGGGGYVLYSPNMGKKRPAKAVGTFPTKLGAKKAELARFPPKDPAKLKRARASVDKLLKDPKKRADKERAAAKEKGGKEKDDKKNESVELIRPLVRAFLYEALFHEERSGSEWDQHLTRISKNALDGDKKFQSLQTGISKKTEAVLKTAIDEIQKSLRGIAKVTGKDVKHSPDKGKTYMMFSVELGSADVGPIFIYVENGVPKIEISDQAKSSLNRVDPADAKKFRAELITVQERVLDHIGDLIVAIGKRDKYLSKIEHDVDSVVSQMTSLEIALLKNVLVKKYAKV